MSYLPAVVVFAVGVVLLVIVTVRTIGVLRRFSVIRAGVGERMTGGVGLLRARSAALGIALARRRGTVRDGGPRSIDSHGPQEDPRVR